MELSEMNERVILIYGAFDLISVDDPLGSEYSPIAAIQGKMYPPLGLLYLASMLEKYDISVSLLDISLLKNGIKDAIKVILSQQPKVIGIYVSSFNLPLVKIIISKIKNLCPDSIVVIGGPHVHYEPVAVEYLNADFGIVSDGEYSFLEFVKSVFNDNPVDNIPNLVRKTDKGICVNPLKIIENLDDLPFPARHLWPHKFYFSPIISGLTASTMSSRGCLFNCSFCAYPNKGEFRARSADNVIEELITLERDGFRNVEFHDDFFTFDRYRVEDICKKIIKKKIKIKWTCMSRVDFVDKYLLNLMRRANCTHIKYGIESGSDYVRSKIMKKNITSEQIKKAIIETKKAGILTIGYFVLGMPGETQEDIKSTLEFAQEINIDYVDFNIIRLIPGSHIFYEAIKEKRISYDIWRWVANGHYVPYGVFDKLNLSTIAKLRAKAMRQHYLNFKFFIKELFLRTRDLSSFLTKIKILYNLINFKSKYKDFQNKFSLKI